VALLLSAVAIMPVFGAVTGTVAASKEYVAADGTVTVTVTDIDLSVSVAYATETFTTSGSGLAGVAQTFPLAGIGATDRLVASSLRAGNSGYYIAAGFQQPGGVSFITLIPAANESAATAVAVGFQEDVINTNDALVTISSPLSTGFPLLITETAANTGIFTGSFAVSATATSASATPPTIQALAGMDITMTYADGDPAGKRVETIRVEATAPTGTLVSPANGSTTTSQTPTLSVNFTDADSGLLASGILTATWISSASWSSDGGATENAIILTQGLNTTAAITNGFSASRQVTAGVLDNVTTRIEWIVTGTDEAGNAGSTDSDADVANSQPFVLVIDKQKPDFANGAVRAGAWWNADTEKVINGATGDEDESLNTSIGIKLGDVFDGISESLNASTVTAADFEIDGLKLASDGSSVSDLTPTAALVPAGATNWIFLTVPAMAPDASPTINLTTTAGGISDASGNAQDVGVTSGANVDEIAPTLTVSIDKNLSTDKATLTISTNETITQLPVVTHSKTNGVAGSTSNVVVTTTGVNQWKAVVTPAAIGAYSLKVAVADGNGNSASVGSASPVTDGFPLTGDIALYIDTDLAAPTVTPANAASVEIGEPFFITVNFAAETSDLDTNSANKNDAHKKVTITSITLDGDDISHLLDPQGESTSFDIAKSGMTIGDHTLVVQAEDSAGNDLETSETTTTFTVTARQDYAIGMSAGWNLVSFPGNPVDGAIGAVFPATHPATDVLSYDDGVWTVGSRTAGGVWEGTLTTIDGNHGYWVNSSSSADIESLLALPSVGSASTLPTIKIEAGWNLVSVIDLDQAVQSASAATQTAANYFTSITWSVAYTYDSSTRVWTRVTDATGNVSNGQGVWVWTSKTGTLIP